MPYQRFTRTLHLPSTTAWQRVTKRNISDFKLNLGPRCKALLASAPSEPHARVAFLHEKLVAAITETERLCLPQHQPQRSGGRRRMDYVTEALVRQLDQLAPTDHEGRQKLTDAHRDYVRNHHRRRLRAMTAYDAFDLLHMTPKRSTRLPQGAPPAEALAEHYAETLREPAERHADYPPPPNLPAADPSTVPLVSLEEVRTGLMHKLRGSRDPDGISPRTLRILPHEAHVLLQDLFTVSLCHSAVPAPWRVSVITPRFKSGRPVDRPASFRPVANTSLVSRSLEHVILTRLGRLIDRLHEGQHGFRRGKGTHTALSAIVTSSKGSAKR
jgi:hypothetical protein